MTCSAYRTLAFVCALGAASTVLLAQTPSLPQFRAGAVLVTVDAYPQQDGRIVEGLAAEDFDVLEDGKPQKVENLEFVRIDAAPPDAIRRDPNNLGEMRRLAADPHNRVFVAFLDQLHTTIEGSHAIRQPLIDTLRRLVGPDDLFGVMTQNMKPEQLTLGRALTSIEQQLTKYWAWGERQRIGRDPADPVEDDLSTCFHQYLDKRTNPPEWRPWLIDEGPQKRYFDDILVERRREDRTLTSLEDLVRYIPKMREARTVILAISDGWMLFSSAEQLLREPDKDARTGMEARIPPPFANASDTGTFRGCLFELERLARMDNQRRFRDLLQAANASNVSFYPVATTGLAAFDSAISERVIANPDARTGSVLGRDAGRVGRRVDSLRVLAENTDGVAVTQTNDLASGLRRIVDDVSAYYLLGYYSTNTRNDGRFRKIQVRMKRRGLSVRARRGYLAPTEDAERIRASATAPVPAVAAVPAGLNEALATLGRLQQAPDLFVYSTSTSTELLVVAEISSALTSAGRWGQGGEVRASVTGPNGEAVGGATARIEPGARAALLRVPLSGSAATAAQGPWRVALKIAGAGDTLEDRVSAEPSLRGPLLGAPIVYRAAPGPRSPIRPVADFQFRRTERAHVEWLLLKPVDQRQARLLSRTGQPLAVAVNLSESPGGAQALAADVNLAALGPGDYVIEVAVGAGAETERRFVAIRVNQ